MFSLTCVGLCRLLNFLYLLLFSFEELPCEGEGGGREREGVKPSRVGDILYHMGKEEGSVE